MTIVWPDDEEYSTRIWIIVRENVAREVKIRARLVRKKSANVSVLGIRNALYGGTRIDVRHTKF